MEPTNELGAVRKEKEKGSAEQGIDTYPATALYQLDEKM